MRLPRPFKNVRAPVNDSFSEVSKRKVITLQKFARLWLSSQQSGVAFEAGSFVEHAVKVKEPLGIAASGVRIFCDDFVSSYGSGHPRHRIEQESYGSDPEKPEVVDGETEHSQDYPKPLGVGDSAECPYRLNG